MKQSKSTEWIRFLSQVRSNFTSTDRVLSSGEPFASSCYKFFARSRKSALAFGIDKLYLRTMSGGVERVFSLTESDGHLNPEKRELPQRGNYEISHSRAMAMYSLVNPDDDTRRVQAVAYFTPGAQLTNKDVQSFCNYLAQEFVLQERATYFQAIEDGASETRRLLDKEKSSSILPGTFALAIVSKISRSVSAKLGAFGICGPEQLYLEYAKSNYRSRRPHILNGAEVLIPNPAVYSRLMSDLAGNYAVKLDLDHPVYGAFARVTTNGIRGVSFEGDELWVVPVSYDNQILGLLLFAFPVASYGFSDAAYNLAKIAAEGLSGPTRYLYQRRLGHLIVDPIFNSRETRVKRDQGFLIMPFGEPWSDAVASIVKDVLNALDVSVIRADKMHGDNVMEDVWTALLSSQYVVADVTGRNSNVYYELGIAHTLGKKVILLTQEASDIPFDTRHLRHIVYSNDLSGHDSIRAGITGFVRATS